MAHARTENPAWVPELELPVHLRERCARAQDLAPYLGLGFRRERLAPALHARLLAHFRENISRFRAEHSIEEIGNVSPRTIPSLVFVDDGEQAA